MSSAEELMRNRLKKKSEVSQALAQVKSDLYDWKESKSLSNFAEPRGSSSESSSRISSAFKTTKTAAAATAGLTTPPTREKSESYKNLRRIELASAIAPRGADSSNSNYKQSKSTTSGITTYQMSPHSAKIKKKIADYEAAASDVNFDQFIEETNNYIKNLKENRLAADKKAAQLVKPFDYTGMENATELVK
jgi:hypothetical protein